MTEQQTQAMRQALEALNEVTGWQWVGPMDEVEDAITALRQALEQKSGIKQVIELYDSPEHQPAEWEHLKEFGYAPGGYMMTCHGCNNEVIDVDKRASTCRTCAETMYAKKQQPAAPEQKGNKMTPQPEALRLAQALKDGAGLDSQWDAAKELCRLHEENERLKSHQPASHVNETSKNEHEPADEPVAWRAWFDADNRARWLFSLWPKEELLDVEWQPLYTSPPASKPLTDEQPVSSADELPKGFVPLQQENGKIVYAACLDPNARHYKWLMWKHPDGQWVSKRKLEEWEVMQAEDQSHYGIILGTSAHGIKE